MINAGLFSIVTKRGTMRRQHPKIRKTDQGVKNQWNVFKANNNIRN